MYHSVTFQRLDSDPLAAYGPLTKYNTYDDWGLYLAGPVTVSPPEVYSYIVDIPGRNGALDLTESLTGDVSYYDREISCKFVCQAPRPQWPGIHGQIMNAIHGRRMKIVLSDDPDYYYEGRVYVDKWGTEYENKMEFPEIHATVAPYALEVEMREYTANLSNTKTVSVSMGGENVSRGNFNVDYRWGSAEVPTCDWSPYNSITIDYTTYPDVAGSVKLQVVDADGNVYENAYSKTEYATETGTITLSKSTLTAAGITWDSIYRILLGHCQAATVTAQMEQAAATIMVDGTYKPVVPVIFTTTDCTMTVRGQTYTLDAGETYSYEDLVLDRTGATFAFVATNPSSTAKATIRYRGGKL